MQRCTPWVTVPPPCLAASIHSWVGLESEFSFSHSIYLCQKLIICLELQWSPFVDGLLHSAWWAVGVGVSADWCPVLFGKEEHGAAVCLLGQECLESQRVLGMPHWMSTVWGWGLAAYPGNGTGRMLLLCQPRVLLMLSVMSQCGSRGNWWLAVHSIATPWL